MNKTPWAKPSASSFPSDRLRTSSSSPSNANNQGKGKNRAKEPPKSKEIKRLEIFADAVRACINTPTKEKEKDVKGGCFCQAREHKLSPYIALCLSCGLPLCSLNPPYSACPSCSSGILSQTPTLRATILARIEDQISAQIAKEERARESAAEEARRAVGAFPTLAGSPGLGPGAPSHPSPSQRPLVPIQPQPQTHKVLSLNSKTKKVMISSYTKTPSPSNSRPISRADDPDYEPEPIRVPRPKGEVVFVGKLDATRPWADLRDESNNVRYIAPPASTAPAGEGGDGEERKKPRRPRGGKKIQKEKENRETDQGGGSDVVAAGSQSHSALI